MMRRALCCMGLVLAVSIVPGARAWSQSAAVIRVDNDVQQVQVAANATAYGYPCEGDPVYVPAEGSDDGQDDTLVVRSAGASADAGDNVKSAAVSTATAETELPPGANALGGVTAASSAGELGLGAVASPIGCVYDAGASAQGSIEAYATGTYQLGDEPCVGAVSYVANVYLEVTGFADLQATVSVGPLTILAEGTSGVYHAYVLYNGTLVEERWDFGALAVDYYVEDVVPRCGQVQGVAHIRASAQEQAYLGQTSEQIVTVHASAGILDATYVQ